MLTQNLTQFPPSFNVERFMADLFHIDHPDALALDRHRDAQGLDDAEIAHSAFACLDVECRRERCIALQERLIAAYPHGLTVCHICNCTVSNLARLDCAGCAA